MSGESFDPEGPGYDMETAVAAGLQADATGHWPSREPKSGQILKGQKHPTYALTTEGEAKAGHVVSKGVDGKYYSQPKAAEPLPSNIPRYRIEGATDADGDLSNDFIRTMTGETAERLGYLPARDEGPLREFLKGSKRGIMQVGSSLANTFGAKGVQGDIDYFLDNNPGLSDSDRKGAWSYAANVIGSQLGQNLPLMASMLIPGGMVGKVGTKLIASTEEAAVSRLASRVATKTVWNTAEKATYESAKRKAAESAVQELVEKNISRNVMAQRSMGAGMNSLMVWGDNMDELRQRMPGVSESSLLAINSILTPLQSFIEIGLPGVESKTARAVGRLAVGKALTSGATQEITKDVIKPGLWGRVGRFGETFVGRTLKTGAWETFEEILQQGATDLSVSTFRADARNDQTADEMLDKYGRIIKEAFLGGTALGLIPTTLNSIADARRRATIRDTTKTDLVKQAKVDEYQALVDINGPATSASFFDRMTQEFGKPAADIIKNVAYNTAYIQVQAQQNLPAEQRQAVRPQDLFKDLTTLVISDPARSEQLRSAFLDKGVAAGVELINQWFPKIKEQMVHWADVDTMTELDRNHAGMRAEINDGAGADVFTNPEPIQENARQAVRAALGGQNPDDYLASVASHSKEALGSRDRIIEPEFMADVLRRMGPQNARIAYALGWIRGVPVQIGGKAAKVAIRLEKDSRGRIGGVVYDDTQAEGLAEQEARRKITEPAAEVKPRMAGPGVQPVVEGPALQVNVEPMAMKMAESVRLGAILNRMKDYDEAAQTSSVRPVAKPAEVMAQPARSLQEGSRRYKAIEGAVKTSGGSTGVPVILEERDVFTGEELSRLLKVVESLDPDRKGVTVDSVAKAAGLSDIIRKDATSEKGWVDVGVADVLTAKKKKAKVGVAGEPALYAVPYRLGVFFQNAGPESFLEETLHHLIANRLLPLSVYQAFVDNYGVAANPDDEPMLDRAGQENAARALFAYLSDNQLPNNPEIASALNTVKQIVASSGGIKQMALAVTRTGVESTESPLKVSEGLRKVFDTLLSEVTPNKIAAIYGEALDTSLGMSVGVRFVSEQDIYRDARRIALATGQTAEHYLTGVLREMNESLDGKSNVAQLTPAQKFAVQQRVAGDFQRLYAVSPEAKASPGYEVKEGASHDLHFVEVKPGTMKEGDAGMAQDLWNVMMASTDKQKALLDWGVAHKEMSPFIQGLTENLSHATDLSSMTALFSKAGVKVVPTADFLASPAKKNFDGMDNDAINKYAHAKYAHQQLHDKAAAMFNKGWSQLTIGQRIDVLKDIASLTKPVAAEPAISKIIADATNPGIVSDLTILNSDNSFTKTSKFLAGKMRHGLGYILTPRSWCNVMSGNNPDSALVKIIADPITRGNDQAWVDWTQIAKRIREEMQALGRNFDTAFRTEKIGNRSFTRSQIAYYYVQANGGANMGADSRVADVAVANGLGSTADEALSVVRDMVRFARADADMLAWVDITQKIMREVFVTKAAPVYKDVTGKEAKPIQGMYATIVNTDDTLSPEDQAGIFETMTGLPQRGATPSQTLREFLHRGEGRGRQVNDDYFGITVRHINTMLNYASKAKAIKTVMDALNAPSLETDYRKKFGNLEYLDTIKKLLLREMSPRGKLRSVSAPGDTAIRFLTGNAAKVFLSWNPGPLLNQFVSMPLFMATVPARLSGRFAINMLDFAGQLAMSRGKIENTAAYKLVKKFSPDLLELMPSPDVRRINEIMEAKEITGLGVGATWFAKFLDIGMMPLQSFDMLPRLTAWKTAFEGKLDMLEGTGMSQVDMEQAAKSFADDAVNKSFNPASKTERGLIQSEAPEALKSTMLFTSQPFANCRWFISDMVLPMLQSWKDGGPGGVMRTLRTNPQLFYKLGLGVLLPGLAMGALGRRRPQKDIKEVLTDAIGFGILNTIPILGHILWFNAAFGFSGGGSDMGGVHGRLISEVTKAIGDVIGGKADFETARSAERTVSLLTRIPDYPFRIMHKLMEQVVVKGSSDISGEKLMEIFLGKRQP
jgi:hypothetical protein